MLASSRDLNIGYIRILSFPYPCFRALQILPRSDLVEYTSLTINYLPHLDPSSQHSAPKGSTVAMKHVLLPIAVVANLAMTTPIIERAPELVERTSGAISELATVSELNCAPANYNHSPD